MSVEIERITFDPDQKVYKSGPLEIAVLLKVKGRAPDDIVLETILESRSTRFAAITRRARIPIGSRKKLTVVVYELEIDGSLFLSDDYVVRVELADQPRPASYAEQTFRIETERSLA